MLCIQQPTLRPPHRYHFSHSSTVDISLLLKPRAEDDYDSPASSGAISRQPSVPSSTATAPSTPGTTSSLKRPSGTQIHPLESPAKKQSKWSPEEDAKIIQLRGEGMKWEDISRHLPGRSAISCRLHYQNYLERRSEWDEDRKNKLARLYER